MKLPKDYLETFFSILTVENVNIDDTLFKELNIESLDQDLIFCLAVQCLISNLGIPKFKSNLCALSAVELWCKESLCAYCFMCEMFVHLQT